MTCNMSDIFEKIGDLYYFTGKDGKKYPVLFCPFCGQKVEYDKKEE